MHRFLALLLFIFGLSITPSFSQDTIIDGNLVPNGDFENYSGKLIKMGRFYLVDSWDELTPAKADLFEKDNPLDQISIPENMYGYQEAFSGDHYVGINAFSYDPKNYRTYLVAKLIEPLKKGELYCVKYFVNLSDRSRMGVANLGAYFASSDESTEERINLYFEAQIKNNFQKVLKNRASWETVCNVLTATGKEKYLIIGNMDTDAETISEKLGPPEGLSGPQVQMAYYYVDDVSVKSIDRFSACNCSAKKERGPDIVYSKASAIDEKASDEEVISGSTIYFGFLKKEINSSAKVDLDRLASLLIAHPAYRVKISGHTDQEEAQEIKGDQVREELARDRAYAALDYLAKKGLKKSRFDVYGMDDKVPASYSQTPLSKAKNRRVEFELITD